MGGGAEPSRSHRPRSPQRQPWGRTEAGEALRSAANRPSVLGTLSHGQWAGGPGTPPSDFPWEGASVHLFPGRLRILQSWTWGHCWAGLQGPCWAVTDSWGQPLLLPREPVGWAVCGQSVLQQKELHVFTIVGARGPPDTPSWGLQDLRSAIGVVGVAREPPPLGPAAFGRCMPPIRHVL